MQPLCKTWPQPSPPQIQRHSFPLNRPDCCGRLISGRENGAPRAKTAQHCRRDAAAIMHLVCIFDVLRLSFSGWLSCSQSAAALPHLMQRMRVKLSSDRDAALRDQPIERCSFVVEMPLIKVCGIDRSEHFDLASFETIEDEPAAR